MNMSKKEYNRYVARLAQKSPLGKDLLRSFLVGGLICVIGQLILNGFTAAGPFRTGCRRGHLGQSGVFERRPDGPERL